MPTVRKKFMALKKIRPKKDAKVLTEKRYNWLVSGMPELIGEQNPFDQEEDQEICCRANKNAIMDRWFTQPIKYCQRPDCWWKFENVPPAEILGYEKWWDGAFDSGAGWEFAAVEEPDFLRIEKAGDLRDSEKSVFEKEKERFSHQLEGMRTLGIFFDPLEEVEIERAKEMIPKEKVISKDVVRETKEKISEPVVKQEVKSPVPIIKNETKFTDPLEGVVVGNSVCKPVRLEVGVCPRCQKVRKTEFCRVCGAKIPT